MRDKQVIISPSFHYEGLEEMKAKMEALHKATASVITLADELAEAAKKVSVVMDDVTTEAGD